MSTPEPRQVKRPRLSLNCTVCRDRKVRCGREHPQCTNCIRMNKTCVYQLMTRDKSTGRVRPLPPGPQEGVLTGKSSDDRESNLTATSLSHPQQREHQVSANGAHPAVPSLEEAVQVPRNIDGISGLSGVLSDQKLSLQTPRAGGLPPDYLSVRRGGRVRYIGKIFWGFVAGQENLSDDFLDKNRHAIPDLPLPHIAATGLAILLRSLPTKPVCDALLNAFFIAVWPVMPLVHGVTLQAEYDEFWEWCWNVGAVDPPVKLQDDPTFICLLFAVLFCGASAAPISIWGLSSLQTLQKETTVNDLKAAYETSLSMCKHFEHPTHNTLVSTLLTGPFMDESRDPMRVLISVNTTVRIAQAMGFHSESACSDFDPVVREMRRRVWWHIIWLDVQSSVSTGLPLSCGNEMHEAVSMIACARDEDIRNYCAASLTPAESLRLGESVAMIYAIGRFETSRLESTIVTRLQSPQGMTAEMLKELATATKQVHQRIDTLLAKIPTQEISEKGSIPSPWGNASPVTHPSLYKDDASQPTVIASLTRIMLMLLKSDVLILLQKPFLQLPETESPQARKSWKSIAKVCWRYLRSYLNLYQAPAFAPYMWSFCRGYGPLQCTFLLLIYLLYFRQAPDYHQARYYVDKIIDHFVSRHQSPNSSLQNASLGISKPPMPVAIEVLVDLHRRLDLPVGKNELPSVALNLKPAYSPVFDQKFLASISELEVLSSLLVMESDKLFGNCQPDDIGTSNYDGR